MCNKRTRAYKSKSEEKNTSPMIPARFVLIILAFFGSFNLYAMRVNLSVAIVAMVRPSLLVTNDSLHTCPELIIRDTLSIENDTIIKGEFDWDSRVQGQVVGSFFYGYLVTQIPAGILAEKYGAKWIYGLGILITALSTLLTPVAARWSVWALIAVRVMEGLAGGVAFPAFNVLIAKWVPKTERSRLTTIMNMGCLIGTLTTYVVAGILCESSFFGGWPSVFYTCGTLGCVWFIFWAALAYESPDIHPRISKKELRYILESQDNIIPSKDVKIPWKLIWTSMPVWATIVAHFGQNWAFYTLMTMMPTYLSNVLHLEMKKNGIISGLPYLMMALFAFPASIIADKLRESGCLLNTTIRKTFNSIAFFGPGICILVIAFLGCHPIIIIVSFMVSYGLNGLIFSGYIVNHVDISPRFAGTLMGITNAIATLPGILAPSLVGFILSGGQTLRNWSFVYIVTSAIYFLSGIFYDIFASAEQQSWGENMKNSREQKRSPNIESTDF